MAEESGYTAKKKKNQKMKMSRSYFTAFKILYGFAPCTLELRRS